jgi:hypothetical protein
MNVINLTPHKIVVRYWDDDSGPRVSGITGPRKGSEKMAVFPPSGTVARVEFEEDSAYGPHIIPTIQRRVKGISGIPAADGQTAYLVSSMVLDAVQASGPRADVFAPDTGKTAIRNEAGQIAAVTRLVACWTKPEPVLEADGTPFYWGKYVDKYGNHLPKPESEMTREDWEAME